MTSHPAKPGRVSEPYGQLWSVIGAPARRAIRKDAVSYVRAFHETTSRLERFAAVHDRCYAAVAAAILPAARQMKARGQ